MGPGTSFAGSEIVDIDNRRTIVGAFQDIWFRFRAGVASGGCQGAYLGVLSGLGIITRRAAFVIGANILRQERLLVSHLRYDQ
jgi:hypothetical protein